MFRLAVHVPLHLPRQALRGGIQKSISKRPCQVLPINAHKMAPRAIEWFQERLWDAPTKGLAWTPPEQILVPRALMYCSEDGRTLTGPVVKTLKLAVAEQNLVPNALYSFVEVDGCGAENADICRFGADSGTERAAQLVYDRDGRFTAARAGYQPPDE